MKEFLKVYKTNFLSPIFSFSWLRLRPVVPSPGSRFWMHFFQDPLSALLSDGTRTQKCIHKRNIASHFTIQKSFSAQAIFLHILYSICGVKWVIKFSNLSFWEPAKNKLSTQSNPALPESDSRWRDMAGNDPEYPANGVSCENKSGLQVQAEMQLNDKTGVGFQFWN